MQRDLQRPRPAGHVSRSATKRTHEPWVNGSPRWLSFQQESAIDANAVCRGGERIDLGKNGSGVPGPLLFPQRFGLRDGQKHLPEINTPEMTYGNPGATNNHKDARQSASDCES